MDISPVLVSLKTASAAIVFTFLAGLAAAVFTVQLRHRVWKMLFDALFTLPLVLPPTVAGFFLLTLFGVRGPIGTFFLDFFAVRIAFSWGATVLAATVISFPLMYRSSRGALEQLDWNLVYAARSLGMGEWEIFWKVSFPTCLPGIASGTVLAFARALGEFGATAMIAGNIAGRTRTLPLAVYSAVAAGDMENAYAYVIIIIIISFVIISLLNWFTAQEKRKRTSWKSRFQ